jgi:hypothetical protein
LVLSGTIFRNTYLSEEIQKTFFLFLFELSEMVKGPVISKRVRVAEELELGKELAEGAETDRDTVRKAEVAVDEAGASQRKEGRGFGF